MSVLSSKIPVEMQYSIRDGLKKFFEQYHPLTDSTQKYVWGKEVRLSFSSKPTLKKISVWRFQTKHTTNIVLCGVKRCFGILVASFLSWGR